jgi:hypothetical protein
MRVGNNSFNTEFNIYYNGSFGRGWWGCQNHTISPNLA